jgi:hypothetical protein
MRRSLAGEEVLKRSFDLREIGFALELGTDDSVSIDEQRER